MADAPGSGGGPARAHLYSLLSGARVVQAISVAAAMRLPDRLQSGAKTSSELAAVTSAHEPSLYRLLRALASAGVLDEHDDRNFTLTAAGELLCRDSTGSLWSMAVMRGSAWEWSSWAALRHSVETGQTAFDHVFNQPMFEYLQEHPSDLSIFEGMMTGVTAAACASIIDAYDFSDIGTLIDVGGGHGTLVAHVLARYPHVRAVLFDQPAVIDGARAHLEAAGVSDRCEPIGGDFFASIPAGGDIYVLQSILHNWDDALATAILRACRRAISEEGRLLVIEWMVPPGNGSHPSKLLDLQMLVLLGGRERTEREFRWLFAQAGFSLTTVAVTSAGFSIIEAAPAEDPATASDSSQPAVGVRERADGGGIGQRFSDVS